MDATIQTLKIDKVDDELSTGRQQVVKLLRSYKETKNGAELRRRNVVFDEDHEEAEEPSEESTPSTLQRFNNKLKKKETERLQRMNRTVDDDNGQDVDEVNPPKKVSKGAFVSEDDDSQENQREVILSYPSSSSTELPGTSNSQLLSNADGISCDTSETPFDASDNEENDLGDEDSTYASMDEENGVEMVDLDEQNSVFESAAILDPVIGTSSATSSHSGQVASLVSQNAADWLIDDVGSRNAKRKRQAKITHLARSTDQTRRTSATSRPKQRLSLSKSQKGPHPKQSRLVVSKETRTAQSASDLSMTMPSRPTVISTVPDVRTGTYTPTASSRHLLAPGGTPPMRLRVWVQDKMFLIPCPQGNAQQAKNIGWLAEQVCFALLNLFFTSPLQGLNIA